MIGVLNNSVTVAGVKCDMTDCHSSPGVLLTSEGPAAEYQGGSLGQFLLMAELHKGAACYRQRQTVPGDVRYLYRWVTLYSLQYCTEGLVMVYTITELTLYSVTHWTLYSVTRSTLYSVTHWTLYFVTHSKRHFVKLFGLHCSYCSNLICTLNTVPIHLYKYCHQFLFLFIIYFDGKIHLYCQL